MLNQVTLVGRSGKDVVVRTTESGKKVASFTMATWVSYRDESHESGWKTITEWHNIVQWGEHVDKMAERMPKGTMVCVTGSIRTRSYTAESGQEKYITEVVGTTKVLKAGEKKEEKPKAKNEPDEPPYTKDDIMKIDDDMPF